MFSGRGLVPIILYWDTVIYNVYDRYQLPNILNNSFKIWTLHVTELIFHTNRDCLIYWMLITKCDCKLKILKYYSRLFDIQSE